MCSPVSPHDRSESLFCCKGGGGPGLGVDLGIVGLESQRDSQPLLLSDMELHEVGHQETSVQSWEGGVQDRSRASILNFQWSTKHLLLVTCLHPN